MDQVLLGFKFLFRKLDISDLAIRTRTSYISPLAATEERDIDHRILTCARWGEISQAGSFCLPQSQVGGLFSVLRVACGSKTVIVQSTEKREHDEQLSTDDFRYFRGARVRDTMKSTIGGRWAAGIISGSGQL